MNPLASTKCARRLLMALAAMTGILLIAGCGSSGIIHSLGSGLRKSRLKGQYVMSQTGVGVNQQGTASDPFSETIVFTADGNGKLNITVDDFDQVGGPFTLSGPLTGTYGISSDGTGFLVFNFNTTTNYAITMIDDSHFYIIEQDFFATASGFGEKQDTNALTSAPSGGFVFHAHEIDTSSRVGGITITAGAIAGTEDFLSLGSPSSKMAITTSVAMTAPDATNCRGTFTSSARSSFRYYSFKSST